MFAHHPPKNAFTLLELLIVVAIIAILAAIAVPNFLEAQTRSKISRSQADMRSLATALEAYGVDHGRYPHIPEWPNQGWDNPNSWLRPLTTPVAFIAELPSFPWSPWKADLNYDGITERYTYYYYNNRQSFIRSEDWEGNRGFVWELFETYIPWNAFDPDDCHEYYLGAPGPDGDVDQQWAVFDPANPDDYVPGSNCLPYDPTNGTISNGDIIRLGP